jgi:arylsulfatase A-like enzyme
MILFGTALPEEVYRDRIVDGPVENIDILPTLLSFAGIEPERNLPAISLLEDKTREVSFSALRERKGQAAFM